MDLLDEKQRKRLVRVIVKSNIIIACIYIAICLLIPSFFCWRFLLFLFFISWLAGYCFRLYIHECIKEKIHTVTKPAIKKQWWKMPLWEWGHWAIVVVFFFLTAWAMWSGLDSLFKESGSNSWFVFIFTLCVTFTLFWLVIMITRNRHIWGFILFYVIFDLLSAFTFNFIHFYDNVSATQRTDATMKACQMFLDLERNAIFKTTSEADSLLAIYNYAVNKGDSIIRYNDSEIEKLKRKEGNEHRGSEKRRIRKDWKQLEDQNDEIRKLRLTPHLDLQAKASLIREKTTALVLYDSLYNANHNMTAIQEKDVKDLMQSLYQTLEKENKLNSNSCSDSINYALHVIQKKGGNRFDSFIQLYDLIGQTITNEFLSTDSISTNSTIHGLALQEKRLENGILYQSIALSALIDAVPLALGIFVSWAKRREEDEKFEKMNAA